MAFLIKPTCVMTGDSTSFKGQEKHARLALVAFLGAGLLAAGMCVRLTRSAIVSSFLSFFLKQGKRILFVSFSALVECTRERLISARARSFVFQRALDDNK